MVYKFPVQVTRELIESKVSQETLMETYYGRPVKKGLFTSTTRRDARPTVAYYKNKNGRLIVKDFGSDFCGDWVYVIQQKYDCTYYKALHIAANDLGLIDIPNINKNPVKISNVKLNETVDSVIQVEIKDFEQYEINWWAKYGVTEDLLKKYNIFSCKNIFLNGELFHLHKQNQLIFGYYGGVRNEIERWKIYMPGRKYKFLSNWKSIMIQGINQLPKEGDLLIITKSMKDLCVLTSLGFNSIAPMCENSFITDSQYNKLKYRFKKIILFYDNDLTGVSFMNKIRKKHEDIIPIWIPRKYNAKDISDFYKIYGHDKTLELIEEGRKAIEKQKG